METIETLEELEELCNEFLATITDRKNKAIKVIHREDSTYKRYDTYVLKYSKEYEYGFHTDVKRLADTGKISYMDSVGFMYNHRRYMYFWLDNTNCFAVQNNRLILEFNGYRYSIVDRYSDDYDYLAKCGVMIDLKLKLKELFKQH